MNKQYQGTIALIITTMIYGSYGILNRFIGNTFGTFSQSWVRNLMVMVIVILIILAKRERVKTIRRNDKPWVFVWMLTGSTVMLLLFQAFNHLPVTTVYFLFYSTTILSGVLCGKIFFKESITHVKIASILFSILGLIIIYMQHFEAGDLKFMFMSLIAGAILGFWNTISKKFSRNYSNLHIVLLDAIAGVVIAILGTILFTEALPVFGFNFGWLWMAVYAVLQIGSVGLLVYGFRNLEAQIASLILPIEIIFASIFSFIVFKEILPITTLIGGCVIVLAALLPNVSILKNRNS